ARKPSLLIVLNRLPDELSFLTAKFVGLDKQFDLDILAWDTPANREKYYSILRSNGFAGKIYLQPMRFSLGSLAKFMVQNVALTLRPAGVFSFLSNVQRLHRNEVFKRLFFNSYFIRSHHDIWHFEFGAISPWYSYLKEIFPQKKMTVSFRGYDLNYVGLDSPGYYSPTWDRFDGYHFLGNDLRNRAIKRGYKPGRLETIIPPAIDTSFFVPGIQSQINNEKLIIVSTGRLVWKKGFEYGIRAAYLLKQKGIPFEYRIIGEGPHLQAIQYTIEELGLENEVKLLGRMQRDGVREQLRAASVFLHPAISEGFCNAVLEAQAVGVPVVCTNADGLAENVVDGETGFVVDKWDVNEMAEKLTWCYKNASEAWRIGRNGAARVQRSFRKEDQIASFVEFYNKVYQL
ncbi:MAG: putative glycosyltransferase, partial [Flavipsychrobacter sp.]|nr:putative glycosyltransferase [Flavipsychrobacter sp.]